MSEHEPMSEFDMVSLEQDPNDQVWPSEPVEPNVGGPSHPGLRTAHGGLDIMTEVIEEGIEWIERETEHGPGHKRSRQATYDRAATVDTYPRGSNSWRGVTYNVGNAGSGGIRIAMQRDDRARVVVTNWGPGVVYVAHESGTGLLEPQQNVVQIAPPGPDATVTGRVNWREWRTRGELWAFPAVPGTAQLVDVQDEYGYPDA